MKIIKCCSFIIIAIELLVMSACSQSDEKTSSEVSKAESKISSESENSEKEEIKSMSSSLSTPLELNAWGSASKYSTAEQKYYDVPVRITNLIRGDKADNDVRTFMNGSDEYTYRKPDKGEEWIVAEYELCLDGFPLDEGGTDCSVVSFVMGNDGGYVKSNGKDYNPVTINITDEKYYFEGVHSGKIAFTLPEKCKDYLIVLGEYEEDQAYFKLNK